jgi:hypothetical protein
VWLLTTEQPSSSDSSKMSLISAGVWREISRFIFSGRAALLQCEPTKKQQMAASAGSRQPGFSERKAQSGRLAHWGGSPGATARSQRVAGIIAVASARHGIGQSRPLTEGHNRQTQADRKAVEEAERRVGEVGETPPMLYLVTKMSGGYNSFRSFFPASEIWRSPESTLLVYSRDSHSLL